jgi:hypothetical protein
LILALLILLAIAAAPPSLTDETENYRLLQAMPRERRLALLENLARFDRLSPVEQAKIRKLNNEIATKNADDQRRYRSMMRRYELWVNSLTTEQQEELQGIEDPEARFNMALKYRKQEQKSGSASQRIFGIRTGYFNLMGPFEAAQALRIWQTLTPAERYALENRDGQVHYGSELREYNKKNPRVKAHPFPIADERHYDAILDGNAEFKKQMGSYSRRMDIPSKKDDNGKAKAEPSGTRFELRFAEFLYFEDPTHKPKPVSQANLEKFSNFCPNWFHAMIDPLSAEDSRNYLTIVYRLIFPEGTEITADWKPSKEKTAVAPGTPRPTPKRNGSAAPL